MNTTIQKHLPDYEAACAKLNIPAELPTAPGLPQSLQDFIQAETMLLVLIASEREDFDPDYNDYDEEKHHPWFDMDDQEGDSAGSGFRLNVVRYGLSYTSVGAPFVFQSEEKCIQFVEKYIDLYKITNKNVLSTKK